MHLNIFTGQLGTQKTKNLVSTAWWILADILEIVKDRNHATTIGTQRSLESSLELEQHIKGHGVVMDFSITGGV